MVQTPVSVTMLLTGGFYISVHSLPPVGLSHLTREPISTALCACPSEQRRLRRLSNSTVRISSTGSALGRRHLPDEGKKLCGRIDSRDPRSGRGFVT